MKDDMEEENREKEIQNIMVNEEPYQEGETKVILDKEIEEQEIYEKRIKAEKIHKMKEEEKDFQKKYRTLVSQFFFLKVLSYLISTLFIFLPLTLFYY